MISPTHLWHKLLETKWKWILVGFALLPAMRLYYVQEMLAALVIFSVLFAVASAVVLIIFLLDRASQQTVAWAEPGVGRLAHRVAEAFEGIMARPVWT